MAVVRAPLASGEAVTLVSRAIIRSETHLHSPAVAAALDAGDVQGAGPAFLAQLEAGALDA